MKKGNHDIITNKKTTKDTYYILKLNIFNDKNLNIN